MMMKCAHFLGIYSAVESQLAVERETGVAVADWGSFRVPKLVIWP